jgi:hypothetical protein
MTEIKERRSFGGMAVLWVTKRSLVETVPLGSGQYN